MNSAGFDNGALGDVRVLELGTLLAGPFCGQLLGDMGAEVIKIEPPGQGDPMRNWGRQKQGEPSLWWPVIARNKQAVTLDLRQAEGQRSCSSSPRSPTSCIENFRPGTLEKWNLGYEQLAAANPRLVMVRVSGYGQTGPYAGRAGFGAIGEAMGGLRYVVGDPVAPPSRVGISIGDALAATFACVGALSALHYREKTGRGQVVDSAIYEAVLGMMESLVTDYDQTGYIRERTGPILPNVAPSNVYPARDGLVLIAANQDTVFRRLCEAMGESGARRRCALREPPVARRDTSRCSTSTSRRGPRGFRRARCSRSWSGTACRRGRSTARRRCSRIRTSRRARRSSRCRTRSSGSCACRTWCRSSPRRRAASAGPRRDSASTTKTIYLGLLGLPRERYDALRAARVI